MKYFKYDALEREPFESGEVLREDFRELYEGFPWMEQLKKHSEAKAEEVVNSPGIVIEDKDKKGVFISIVGKIEAYEYYICYKRPTWRKKRKWFKKVDYLDENYHSIIPQQSFENGLEASLLLFDQDFKTLESKYG